MNHIRLDPDGTARPNLALVRDRVARHEHRDRAIQRFLEVLNDGGDVTRVNCVPPRELTDQHLLAEYRELFRVSRLARELKSYGQYTMGTGHVRFFYNKGGWLARRADELYRECKLRGFQVTRRAYAPHPDGLNGGWEPTPLDLATNRARLAERIAAKPGWYRWFGTSLDSFVPGGTEGAGGESLVSTRATLDGGEQ